jgi:hypothetical protein
LRRGEERAPHPLLSLRDDTGAVIDALPFHAGGYQKRTGFMAEVRRDGVDL